MTRRLITIATAILLGASCAHAQSGGMATLPTAGMGMTSPLGLSTSGTAIAPTGIPFGAIPLATPGVSSGSSNGIGLSTACSSPGMAGATTPTSGSTAPFDNSGVGITIRATAPGSAAPAATTCGPTSATGSITSLQSSTTTPANSQLGVPTIPLSSTELSNPGLSPAPCPATGNLSSTFSGAC